MPYKNIEDHRAYQREWARRKREGLPTAHKPRKPMSKDERRVRNREAQDRYYKKLRGARGTAWGTSCLLCGHKKNLVMHNKAGDPHPGSTDYIKTMLKEQERWVRLCAKCHTGVHFCMSIFGWDWETIDSSRSHQDEGSWLSGTALD